MFGQGHESSDQVPTLPPGENDPDCQNDGVDHVTKIATGDESLSNDLWERAYRALQLREPGLVEAYERVVAPKAADVIHRPLSPTDIEAIARERLQDRDTARWVIHLGKQPLEVRKQGERVIKFVLWSKDIVSQSLSAQPYAALAWSSVSILLPVRRM